MQPTARALSSDVPTMMPAGGLIQFGVYSYESKIIPDSKCVVSLHNAHVC